MSPNFGLGNPIYKSIYYDTDYLNAYSGPLGTDWTRNIIWFWVWKTALHCNKSSVSISIYFLIYCGGAAIKFVSVKLSYSQGVGTGGAGSSGRQRAGGEGYWVQSTGKEWGGGEVGVNEGWAVCSWKRRMRGKGRKKIMWRRRARRKWIS